MAALTFNLKKPLHYGQVEMLSPLVQRIMAPNAGPLTFSGTCTYIVGKTDIVIIDPGSDDPAFIAAILDAVADKKVIGIVITHTHRDHTDGIAPLVKALDAPVLGCAPHFNYNCLAAHCADADDHVDYGYAPHHVFTDGEIFKGNGWTLEAVATAGHTANHLSFALHEEHALFSGDHVMGWSTTVIAPPVGDMRDYLNALDKLLTRQENVFYPAHGMPIDNAHEYIKALKLHRLARHEQIRAFTAKGINSAEALTPLLYPELAPHLQRAATMTIAAHLHMLAEDKA